MEAEWSALDIRPIKNGWAVSSGEGWAVHGRTKEEGVRRYHETIEKHREIDTRAIRTKKERALRLRRDYEDLLRLCRSRTLFLAGTFGAGRLFREIPALHIKSSFRGTFCAGENSAQKVAKARQWDYLAHARGLLGLRSLQEQVAQRQPDKTEQHVPPVESHRYGDRQADDEAHAAPARQHPRL